MLPQGGEPASAGALFPEEPGRKSTSTRYAVEGRFQRFATLWPRKERRFRGTGVRRCQPGKRHDGKRRQNGNGPCHEAMGGRTELLLNMAFDERAEQAATRWSADAKPNAWATKK